MEINYSKDFLKHLDKAPYGIQEAFFLRLDLFVKNKNHPLLRNHRLSGKDIGCRSINITGDWRAVFEEFDGGKNVLFYNIGTHSQLYK